MPFPGITTNRLILSDLTDNDDQAILKLFSDEAVIEYYDLEAFTDIEQARETIRFFRSRYETDTGIRWAIRLKETNELIGTCGFNAWSQKMRNAVIGYDLMPAYWRHGYTSEAVSAILSAAFNGDLACGPIHRVQANTVPGNIASEALLIKLGFKAEGLRRDSGYWKGRYHDLKCYGLLQPEFIV